MNKDTDMILPDTVEVYLERWGEARIAAIDAFVRSVARQPLNSQELIRDKASLTASTGIRLDRIYDIVHARHKRGIYKDVIDAIPANLKQTSVSTNLRGLGIRL